jgi:hypothetical protein
VSWPNLEVIELVFKESRSDAGHYWLLNPDFQTPQKIICIPYDEWNMTTIDSIIRGCGGVGLPQLNYSSWHKESSGPKKIAPIGNVPSIT